MLLRRYGFAVAIFIALVAGTLRPAAAQPAIVEPPAAVAPKPLRERLDSIFDEAQWESSHWGVLVQDLNTSEVLYERAGAKRVMPASNMKLFTTAAALETLGPDHRFETHIYASGTTNSAGVLHGNIYILGSGDPSISGRYFDTPTTAILAHWADAISSAGITYIEGDIIGDDDIFDDQAIAGSWHVDYLPEWYAAENSGLAVNENCWDIIIEGGEVVDLLDTSYYHIAGITELTPTSGTSSITMERKPGSNEILLTGSANPSVPLKEWGSVHNGTLFTVTLLKEALENRLVGVAGRAVDIDDMETSAAQEIKGNPGARIHTHVSPPLSEIIAVINKPSQNFYADMVLKAIGASTGAVGSFASGETVVKDLLTSAGVDAAPFNMADGSGLSRRNYVTPRQVVALLAHMKSRPHFPIYEASLPVMGVDGTLKDRMKTTAAAGTVKAKTGTIGNVRSLSGYLTAKNGHKIAFCMIANNFFVPTSQATEAQDRAVLELLSHE